MSYKLVKEDENSFHVQHPDGSVFPVAKTGLSATTAAKIKQMGQEVQHLAEGTPAGDEVSPMTPITSPTADQDAEWFAEEAAKKEKFELAAKMLADSPAPDAQKMEVVKLVASGGGVSPVTPITEEVPELPVSRGIFSRGNAASDPTDRARRLLLDNIPPQGVKDAIAAVSRAASDDGGGIRPKSPNEPNFQAPNGASTYVPPGTTATVTTAPVATTKSQPAPIPQPTPEQVLAKQAVDAEQRKKDDQAAQMLGMDPNDYQIYKSEPKLQPLINMALSSANRASQAAQNQAAIAQQAMQRNQEIEANYAKRKMTLDADRDRIRSALMSQEIDPERWWTSKSTGQQMMSSIGMIIAGAGAGMGGGPNQAFEMIKNLADRDLRAQQMELGKKDNMLSQLMAEGKDAEEAAATLKTASMEYAAYEIQKSALADQDFNAKQSKLTLAATIRAQAQKMEMDQMQQQMAMAKEKAAVISSMNSAGFTPTAQGQKSLAAGPFGFEKKPAAGLTEEAKKKDKALEQAQLAFTNLKQTLRVNKNSSPQEKQQVRAALAQAKLRFGEALDKKGKDLDDYIQEVAGKPWSWFESTKTEESAAALDAMDQQLGIARRDLYGSNKAVPPPGFAASPRS